MDDREGPGLHRIERGDGHSLPKLLLQDIREI
jgi:hypothetical protein